MSVRIYIKAEKLIRLYFLKRDKHDQLWNIETFLMMTVSCKHSLTYLSMGLLDFHFCTDRDILEHSSDRSKGYVWYDSWESTCILAAIKRTELLLLLAWTLQPSLPSDWSGNSLLLSLLLFPFYSFYQLLDPSSPPSQSLLFLSLLVTPSASSMVEESCKNWLLGTFPGDPWKPYLAILGIEGMDMCRA